MKFTILSKYKIPAVETGLSSFIAEDLLESIESDSSLIVTSSDYLDDIKNSNPLHKFEYEIVIRKKI